MRVAIIAPIANLNLCMASNYHMALAHLVLQSEEYATFYRARSKAGAFVLMDNGVVEGNPLPLAKVIEAAKRIDASEIVLPDTIRDGTRTWHQVDNAYQTGAFRDFIKDTHTSVMAVPHGVRMVTWMACLQHLAEYPINTIGLSKFEIHDPRAAVQGRVAMIPHVKCIMPKVEIHFLGLGGSPIEISHPTTEVRGVDSCIPTVAALHNVIFHPYYGLYFRPEWWHYEPNNALSETQQEIARQNITQMLRWAEDSEKYAEELMS